MDEDKFNMAVRKSFSKRSEDLTARDRECGPRRREERPAAR